MCNNYKTFGKSVDTSHWIEARQLYDCVLADIRKHAADVLADNDELCRKLAGQIGTDKAKQEKILEKELRAISRNSLSLFTTKKKHGINISAKSYHKFQYHDMFCTYFIVKMKKVHFKNVRQQHFYYKMLCKTVLLVCIITKFVAH